MSITEEEYINLVLEGQRIFTKIGKEVNAVSNQFIRVEVLDYRRMIDWNELCVALAIYDRLKKVTPGEVSSRMNGQ